MCNKLGTCDFFQFIDSDSGAPCEILVLCVFPRTLLQGWQVIDGVKYHLVQGFLGKWLRHNRACGLPDEILKAAGL